MRFLRDEQLKRHTSIRIGGPADLFCAPKNIEELKEALAYAEEHRLPLSVIGAGTNLLVLDKGFRGLVIQLAPGMNRIAVEEKRATVEAGMLLPRLIKYLAARGLANLEFLAGVPGTVGGAVVMNAGAWGDEISRYVEKVKVINARGSERDLSRKQLKFGYRRSALQGSPLILTEVTFKLREKSKKGIQKKINQYLLKRKGSQPLGTPNCGSVFKNPDGEYAGRLIQEAGCKGMRVGDAQVSAKHGNFILNLGEAKARDVIRLMTDIQQIVKSKYKICLEPEIKIMVKSPITFK